MVQKARTCTYGKLRRFGACACALHVPWGVHDADDVLVVLKGQEVADYEATVVFSGIEHGERLEADNQTFQTHVATACVPGKSSPLAAKPACRCCLNFGVFTEALDSSTRQRGSMREPAAAVLGEGGLKLGLLWRTLRISVEPGDVAGAALGRGADGFRSDTASLAACSWAPRVLIICLVPVLINQI